MMGEVCGEGGVSCNVASAVATFKYLLDRCEVCVCEGCLIVSAVAGCLSIAPYKW